METTTRRNGRISICGWPMDGQWTVDEDAGKLPRQLQPEATSERETKASTAGPWRPLSSSQLSSRPFAWPWPGLAGPLDYRRPARTDLAKAWALGFGPWPTPSCSPPMRNAQCSSSSSSSSMSFRAFAFASTPKRTTMLRPRPPPNLCHPSSCFGLQVQAAKDG